MALGQVVGRRVRLRERQAALHRVGILRQHAAERLHGLLGITGAQVEAAQRVVQGDVRGRRRRHALQVGDRFARQGGGLRVLPLLGGRVSIARVNQPEHAMRLEVRLVEDQRLARGLLRLVAAVLPELKGRDLGPDLRRALVGGRCARRARRAPPSGRRRPRGGAPSGTRNTDRPPVRRRPTGPTRQPVPRRASSRRRGGQAWVNDSSSKCYSS